TGIEVSKEKAELLNSGKSYIQDITSKEVADIVENGSFKAVTDFEKIKEQDVVIICVPTPLRKSRTPNLSYIISATDSVAEYLSPDTLMVLESTTYPGTTKEIVLPAVEEKGFKAGKDIFIAFSPERVDPGNKKYGIKNTPKVVGGIDKKATELAKLLYKSSLDNVITVNSTEEAEMVKLLENTFRAVNIGLINELTKLCDKLELDIWSIIRAAASKPFGFMPFYPGPGLGGHCIPIDPQFLSWKAKSSQFYPHFIDYAEEVNRSMPGFVIEKISRVLNEGKKSINGSKLLVLGVSYKKNVGDTRESPAYEIIKELKKMKAEVEYADPYVNSFMDLDTSDLEKIKYGDYDCVVIVTAHDSFNYKEIVDKSSIVVDCRGVTLGIEGKAKVERI
ncbi:MAG: nucleotide sugar dehydrogenase, partial [Elusimicrobiota bacterium]|nr:nucleotide sugar dehydrogenase [Elusimicrobiota bacterium]